MMAFFVLTSSNAPNEQLEASLLFNIPTYLAPKLPKSVKKSPFQLKLFAFLFVN
jgi:hypothetical protein